MPGRAGQTGRNAHTVPQFGTERTALRHGTAQRARGGSDAQAALELASAAGRRLDGPRPSPTRQHCPSQAETSCHGRPRGPLLGLEAPVGCDGTGQHPPVIAESARSSCTISPFSQIWQHSRTVIYCRHGFRIWIGAGPHCDAPSVRSGASHARPPQSEGHDPGASRRCRWRVREVDFRGGERETDSGDRQDHDSARPSGHRFVRHTSPGERS